MEGSLREGAARAHCALAHVVNVARHRPLDRRGELGAARGRRVNSAVQVGQNETVADPKELIAASSTEPN
jgi:hypothetical protein